MSTPTFHGLSILGHSLFAENPTEPATPNTRDAFRATNPATGHPLEPAFYSATPAQLDRAATLAAEAALPFAATSCAQRAALLRAIADHLEAAKVPIVERAHLETALPLPRLNGEMARTTGQLRLFAELLEEGSWVDARIDSAQPDRAPLPRPDLRSMLRPIGPVAVFGASNFPLAFSVAGGDTAAALAAACPVLVKAHPAHPGTSELVAHAIRAAITESHLPAGIFALLFDSGIDIGQALVQHPDLRAVAFTGSAVAGQALMRLAANRPVPIPCYAEMGSVNPVFLLPAAILQRPEAIARSLAASFTLGSGQFCTKPGLVFVPEDAPQAFLDTLDHAIASLAAQPMLTHAIARRFAEHIEQRLQSNLADRIVEAKAVQANADPAIPTGTAAPIVFAVSLDRFLATPALEEEIFGPTTLLIRYRDPAQLIAAARHLHGHLTATLHTASEDLPLAATLLPILETRVGRVLFNGYPTGVEVARSMVHGGPFPATSDSRSTSVGTAAILRFLRPVCYQDVPDSILPPELQKANPLQIDRLVNGQRSRATA